MKIELEPEGEAEFILTDFPESNIPVGQVVKLVFTIRGHDVILEAAISSKKIEEKRNSALYVITDPKFPRLIVEQMKGSGEEIVTRWSILYKGSKYLVKFIEFPNLVMNQTEEVDQFLDESLEVVEDVSLVVTQIPKNEALSTFEFDLQEGYYSILKRFEIMMMDEALSKTHGHQAKAAKLVGLNTTTFNSKVKKFESQAKLSNSHQMI